MGNRQQQSPRLKREDDRDPPSIRLTDDDTAILWHVFRNRLIDSDSIYRLFPNRSKQQLSRRLNALFRAHYIGRPRRQIELFPPGEGSNHLVYGLDREGARLLSEEHGAAINRYHWLQKNNELTRTNIAHTLATTHFMVDLEIAAREHGRIRVIPFDELLATFAPSRTRALPLPERIRVSVNWNGHEGDEGTIPDRIFGLEYLALPKGQNRSVFFLEIDEGNETVVPGEGQQKSASFFRRSSILRKFLIYALAYRARIHESHFGFAAAPRILTVTTSKVRVESMQRAYREHLAPQPLAIKPGLFLFLTRSNGEPLSMQTDWQNGAGHIARLDGHR